MEGLIVAALVACMFIGLLLAYVEYPKKCEMCNKGRMKLVDSVWRADCYKYKYQCDYCDYGETDE